MANINPNFLAIVKAQEGGIRNEITELRRKYQDYDIGARNFQLYPVKVGKKWWSKYQHKK